MPRRLSVALLIETSNAYARGLLEGIIDYVRRHEPWSIHLPEQERGAKPPAWLDGWDGDGIIARIENDEIAEVVRKLRLPAVDVSAARHVENIPWVETDDKTIAKLAVSHLTERGFRRLGFLGDSRFNWSLWRQQHFEAAAKDAGCELHLFDTNRQSNQLATEQAEFSSSAESSSQKAANSSKSSFRKHERSGRDLLASWVQGLPRPIGIMACYDIQAQQLLDVCRDLDIAVPEEIAVLGVDNDRLLCELANPPLSSVVPNAHRSGYEAAGLLDRMMRGEQVENKAHLIKPIRVETRQSTNVLAIDDAEVARALRFIRVHACDPINVSDVMKQATVSRRVLENRFQTVLGKTPHRVILQARIERVKQLLREPDLTLAEIAARTGYDHVEYLSTAFKRETGLSPSEFRQSG